MHQQWQRLAWDKSMVMHQCKPWKSKGIMPNAPMRMEEQVDIAAKFIDELWSIRVFELILEGQEMKGNTPLFTVPEPRLPDQWRVIADILMGEAKVLLDKYGGDVMQ
jgi:hypothetical protein